MDYTPRRSRLREWVTAGVPAGSIFGIRIRLHILLLLALLYNWTFYAGSGLSTPWKIGLWLFSFAALFGSVLLHELGHCYGAFRVGGKAEQIVLWPLGGLAYASGMEKGPRQELIVTILGPAVSLALAAIFSVLSFSVSSYVPGAPAWLLYGLRHLAFLNWILFAFNVLVPLFPMDSARIIRGLASMRFNPNRVTYILTTVGIYLGATLALLAFFRAFSDLIGPWLGLIGLLGALACWQERKHLEFADVYADGPWYWRDAQVRSETAPEQKSVLAEVKDAFSGLGAQSAAAPQPKPKLTRTEALKKELDEAAEHEDFQRAAALRDQLRDLREKERR